MIAVRVKECDGKTLADAIEKAGRTLECSEVKRTPTMRFAPNLVIEEEASSKINIEVPLEKGVLRSRRVCFEIFLEADERYTEIEFDVSLQTRLNWKGLSLGALTSTTVIGIMCWPFLLNIPDHLKITSSRFPEVRPTFTQLLKKIHQDKRIKMGKSK